MAQWQKRESHFDEQYYNQKSVAGTALETKDNHIAKYQFTLILYALIAVFFYYIGSFLIVFVRNDISGSIISAVPTYEISWRLAFDNFPQLLKNIYDSFFGYFTAYGNLYNRNTAFLIPVDIGIKFITIFYFIFYWIPWDTKRSFRLGLFNDDYPYVSDEFKEEIANNRRKPGEMEIKSEVDSSLEPQTEYEVSLIAKDSDKPVSLYPQYNLNPYLRAQLLKGQKPTMALHSQNLSVNTQSPLLIAEDDNDDDDIEDDGILPFSGVHKPLEELFQQYEKNIYDFIRKRILPGSNLLLVGYFSTLFVVDLANPITFVLYVLGTMSMFWCIQSFLMVIDHIQFPPNSE